jgi:excisionase family DNA binding protein
MRAPDPNEFLTVADVAREIGMYRDTVVKHIKAGAMPGLLFGSTYRIPRVQWEQFKAGTWKAPQSVAPTPMLHRKASSWHAAVARPGIDARRS